MNMQEDVPEGATGRRPRLRRRNGCKALLRRDGRSARSKGRVTLPGWSRRGRESWDSRTAARFPISPGSYGGHLVSSDRHRDREARARSERQGRGATAWKTSPDSRELSTGCLTSPAENASPSSMGTGGSSERWPLRRNGLRDPLWPGATHTPCRSLGLPDVGLIKIMSWRHTLTSPYDQLDRPRGLPRHVRDDMAYGYGVGDHPRRRLPAHVQGPSAGLHRAGGGAVDEFIEHFHFDDGASLPGGLRAMTGKPLFDESSWMLRGLRFECDVDECRGHRVCPRAADPGARTILRPDLETACSRSSTSRQLIEPRRRGLPRGPRGTRSWIRPAARQGRRRRI